MTARHHYRLRVSHDIDWFRVLTDLHYLGLGLAEVSRRLRIPERTIGSWKNAGSEPRYSDGDALLALWREVTGKTREGHPLKSAEFRRLT